jgi:hypothetical protein
MIKDFIPLALREAISCRSSSADVSLTGFNEM